MLAKLEPERPELCFQRKEGESLRQPRADITSAELHAVDIYRKLAHSVTLQVCKRRPEWKQVSKLKGP